MLTTKDSSRIFNHLAMAFGGSLIILAGLYYSTVNSGHEVNPARLIELLKESSLTFFLLYIVSMALGIVLRAKRYQLLIRASGEKQRPSFKDITLITAVRNMTVDLLPARLGELAFVYLLNKRAATQYSTGLSALLFATLLDIVVLAPITIIIGLVVGFPNKQPYLLALIALAIVVGFVLGLRFVLPWISPFIQQWQSHSNKWLRKGTDFALSINDAIQTTLHARIFTQVFGLTILVRVLKYSGLLLLFYGLTRNSFPLMAEMQAMPVLGAMIASEMTASLPVPTLMSFGTWELGGMTLLAFYGAVPLDALLTMLSIHIQTQAIDYGVGIASLFALYLLVKQDGQRYSQSYSPTMSISKKRSWKVGGLFLVLAIALAWWASDYAKDKQAQQVDQMFSSSLRPDDYPVPGWLMERQGFIVWSSNRSGNHDIMLMDLPSLKSRAITDDPHTDNFARISPDGKQVVFARSHEEWQSLRNEKPWDVWLLNIKTGKEQLIAKWGFAPSWSADGKTIIFERVGGFIMAYDLASQKERIYYESGKDKFMQSRIDMSTPSIGRDGRLAFTFSNFGSPTNVVRDKKGAFTVVHRDSCQVMWSPSGQFATYVQKGGRQTNQIMRYDPESQVKTTLVDLPGEHSHEYFPRLSADEKWMIFSASTGGHEHDLADYELFLWPVGSPSSEATRLTFHSGNDSWPDLWLKP